MMMMMMNDTLVILTMVKFLGVEADGSPPYYCPFMDLHQTKDVSPNRLIDRQLVRRRAPPYLYKRFVYIG